MAIARLCLLSLLILGVLAGPAAAAAGDRPLERRLERSLRDVVNGPGGPPGASALLRNRGEEKFITVGVADVDSGKPFRRHQHMRIASTSKAFSGAVALSLVEQGVLALNDTIAEHLPSLTKWGPVTLRQLLSHTGGLPSYTKDPEFLTYFADHIQETDITLAELVAFVADEDPEFTPGTSYEYSNTDNCVSATPTCETTPSFQGPRSEATT